MGLRAGPEGVDLFPGGTGARGCEDIQTRPERGERLVAEGATGVEERQRVRRGGIRQAEVIAQGLRAAGSHHAAPDEAAPEEQVFADCRHDTLPVPSTASK